MQYDKPVLHSLGPVVSLVLGSDANDSPHYDRAPESDLRKVVDIEDGLDD